MALSRTELETHYMEPTKYIKSNRLIVNDNRAYLFVKRFIDFFGALVGLVLLSPLFLVVSILIKLEDPTGGVIFRQIRVGKNGKKFNIYKFRSMVSNAEQLLEGLLDKNETTGAMFKMKDDPRITRIGHFIRKTSIDELPQLLNVLKGDMSLVGPRPPLPREVDEYSDYDMQRLLVQPGCTGLWQISGRSNVGFNQMVEYDLEYIRNRTLLKDIMIMLKTVVQLIWSRGAY